MKYFYFKFRHLFHDDDVFPFVYAFYVCKSKGRLYVKVKLHFSSPPRKKVVPKGLHGATLEGGAVFSLIIMFRKKSGTVLAPPLAPFWLYPWICWPTKRLKNA